ncbi:hypothetical protein SK128_016196, partial [Halocaridina rubra]
TTPFPLVIRFPLRRKIEKNDTKAIIHIHQIRIEKSAPVFEKALLAFGERPLA